VFRVAIFSYCCVYAIWYQCLNNVNLNYISQVEIDVFSLPYHFYGFYAFVSVDDACVLDLLSCGVVYCSFGLFEDGETIVMID
jgi:hypothetical protein